MKIGIYIKMGIRTGAKMDIRNRERIFRAWDKFRKTMTGLEYDSGNIGLLPSCDSTSASSYCSNGNITLINISCKSYDIMEFIGKQDRNNKNIYELDIIEWKEQFNDRFEPIERNDEIFGLVIWSEDRCGFVVEQLTKGKWTNKLEHHTFEYDTNFYSTDGQEFLWEDLEVVGNMYQNPELLVNVEDKEQKEKHEND